MTEPDAIIETHPTREAWLAARKTGLGSSDAAAILGINPYRGPLTIYADKLDLLPDAPQTEAQEWGLRLEPVIAQKFADVTKRQVFEFAPHTLFRSAATPHLIATPDRALDRGGLLELKTSRFPADWADEPPVYYQVQVQHQMMVTGADVAVIAALLMGSSFVYFEIPRSDRFIALLRERLDAFWARLRALDPPEAQVVDMDALAAIYPKDTGETIALPPEAAEWDIQRLAALNVINEQKAIKDEAETRLRAAMRDATFGTLPDGGRYKLALEKRPGYTTQDWEGRILRRLKR